MPSIKSPSPQMRRCSDRRYCVRAGVSGREPGFRNGHPDAVTESLSERSGGDFNAYCVAAFRMAWGLAAPLAETFEFVERQVVAGEMQQAVEQHRAMPGRQHKSIAVEPERISRVVL